MSKKRPGLEEIVGSIIRAAREQAGLSQEALGNEAGSGRTYMSELERGQSSPTIRTLFKLSRRLGIRPSELIKRVESEAGPIEELDL